MIVALKDVIRRDDQIGLPHNAARSLPFAPVDRHNARARSFDCIRNPDTKFLDVHDVYSLLNGLHQPVLPRTVWPRTQIDSPSTVYSSSNG